MAPQSLSVLVNNRKSVSIELPQPTVADVINALSANFPVSVGAPWTLFYIDNEGDRIRIQHDLELKAFFEIPFSLLHASNERVGIDSLDSSLPPQVPSETPLSAASSCPDMASLMQLLGSQALNIRPTGMSTKCGADGNVTVYLDCNVDELPHGFRADIPISVQSGSVFSSSSASSSSSVPIPSAERVHNAFCDICNSTIVGIRYKCVNCPDFDMCQSCEADWREKSVHDLDHFFLKVHTTLPFDWTKKVCKPQHFKGGRCGRRGGHKHLLIERLESMEKRIQALESKPVVEASSSSPAPSAVSVSAPVPIVETPASPSVSNEEKRSRLEYLARRRAESLIAMAKRQAEITAAREAEERAACEVAAAREAKLLAIREAEDAAAREAEERAARDAEDRAAREAQIRAAYAAREQQLRAAREAEEQAREAKIRAAREAEEVAARERAVHEAEQRAAREAEQRALREQQLRAAYAARDAEIRAAREAEERASREAERRAAREAEECVAREAEASRRLMASTVARPVSGSLITPSSPVDAEAIRYSNLRSVYKDELQQLSTMGFSISERELLDLIDRHRDVSEVAIALLDRA